MKYFLSIALMNCSNTKSSQKAMSRIPEVRVDEQNRRMIIIIMINREKYAP